MPGANFHSYTLREPLGVVGQIIPWNFPLLMAAWKLGPALATGNSVVLKPAEQTPLTALRLAELIAEAGVPDGVVNVVPGFGETAGAALAAHNDVDKVAFTGSTEVGKLIVQAAGATNLKKLTLELGGKSPNIVLRRCRRRPRSRARPTPSSSTTASAAWPAPGCSCSRTGSTKWWTGWPRSPSPSSSARAWNPTPRWARWSPTSSCAGSPASWSPAVRRGDHLDRRQPLRRPGLLRRAHRHHRHPPGHEGRPRGDLRPGRGGGAVQSIDEIAAQANDSDYGLGAGIWTKDISKAHALAKKLRAGTVWINCYNVFDASLPFGGYKQSGWGREMGHEALEAYTEVKAVTVTAEDHPLIS